MGILDRRHNLHPVGTVAANSALLLPKDAMLHYTPNSTSNETATITYHAWDTTNGNAGGQADLSQDLGGTFGLQSRRRHRLAHRERRAGLDPRQPFAGKHH